jgi:hypothetical protein
MGRVCQGAKVFWFFFSKKNTSFYHSAYRHVRMSIEPPNAQLVTVLGMHRSGTSLCANVLHAAGLDMADVPGASPENARGHWERPHINDLNDRVFAAFGRGWTRSAHVLALPPGWQDDPRVMAVRDDLVAWLRPRVTSGRFGFKDPRTARLLPLWRGVFAALNVQPRFVFCVRDPAQVARSITARDRTDRAESEYRWLIYNADAIAGLADDAVCIIPYEDWFTRPEATAERLTAFAGVAAPAPDALRALIDPALRHDAAIPVPASALVQQLHSLILHAVPAGVFGPDLQALCASLDAFRHVVQPLLVDMEVLRASVADQNRVIGDLTTALRDARRLVAT